MLVMDLIKNQTIRKRFKNVKNKIQIILIQRVNCETLAYNYQLASFKVLCGLVKWGGMRYYC